MDFMVMQFLRDNRRGINHPDLVDVIFERHVYPFVEQLWGEQPTGRAAFMQLQVLMHQHARAKLDVEAEKIRSELIQGGRVEAADARDLALVACEFGLQSGLDRIVVGMRRTEYVDRLRRLLL